jgi:hypothetical protein
MWHIRHNWFKAAHLVHLQVVEAERLHELLQLTLRHSSSSAGGGATRLGAQAHTDSSTNIGMHCMSLELHSGPVWSCVASWN